MNTTFAKYISIIFHPAIIPTINYFILLKFCHDINFFAKPYHNIVILFVFCWTFLAPSSLIYIMYKLKTIPNLHLEKRSDRIFPLFLLSIYFVSITVLIWTKGLSTNGGHLFYSIIYANALGTILSTIITFFYKASIHAAALAGLCTHIIGLSLLSDNHTLLIPTYVCIILSGVVMSARLALKAHTSNEILIGVLLGVSTNAITLYICTIL